MRNIVCLLILLVSLNLINSYAQQPVWSIEQNGVSMQILHDVFFTDSNHGWIAGGGFGFEEMGVQFNSRNQGKTWDVFDNQQYNFLSVFFVDSLTGWYGGHFSEGAGNYSASIFKTTDGGKTLVDVFKAGGSFLKDVCFINKSTGFFLGNSANRDYSKIFTTIDSGKTWSEKVVMQSDMGESGHLNSIHFLNNNIGWITGDSTLKTIDGGKTWTGLNIANKQNGWELNSISFTDSLNGWIAGNQGSSGILLKTIDGGVSWNVQTNCDNHPLYSLFFINDSIGWAAGSGIILKTTDKGKTWTNIYDNAGAFLLKIFFTDTKNGWAVGSNGLILHTSTGGIDWIKDSQYKSYDAHTTVYPNPASDLVKIIPTYDCDKTYNLKVTDRLGRVVYETSNLKGKLSIDISGYAKGIYFITLSFSDNVIKKKIIKY